MFPIAMITADFFSIDDDAKKLGYYHNYFLCSLIFVPKARATRKNMVLDSTIEYADVAQWR